MQGSLAWLWYEGCYWLSMSAMTLGFGLRMEGRRNVPRRGPALLVANHQSFLDPVAVGLASPRHLTFLARKTLFRGPFGVLIRSLSAVPVDQTGVGKEGLQAVLRELEAGRAVLIFPEGHRTQTGEVQPLQPGFLLLVKRTDASVVPIGVSGTFDAMPPSRKWPRLSPPFLPPTGADVAVSVGRPIPAAHFRDLPRERALQELRDVLVARQRRAERLRRKG